ncbi:hypothetical protein [Stenotrophomonas sp. RAC2]|uniref:hypothetical protein n=1 Tax=Stenotrophomonas sp. RAC2 TaxID=3064902 RepID=UPI0027285A18|nr:hypothetical protein [Stenotrophomonas sp. RAC2]MDV9040358.1 hypothetical protein [Stenotrophomonas sp. RAC2]
MEAAADAAEQGLFMHARSEGRPGAVAIEQKQFDIAHTKHAAQRRQVDRPQAAVVAVSYPTTIDHDSVVPPLIRHTVQPPLPDRATPFQEPLLLPGRLRPMPRGHPGEYESLNTSMPDNPSRQTRKPAMKKTDTQVKKMSAALARFSHAPTKWNHIIYTSMNRFAWERIAVTEKD